MTIRVSIPPLVEQSVRHLHPELKAKIKEALRAMEKDPYAGKPLQGRLSGLRSFRATHYRIVYQHDLQGRIIRIVDIGPRRTIYERLFNWKLP